MFAELPEAPIDPILGMAQAFASDPSPNKVDLGIGIYKDERGEVIVLPTVKAAERALHEGQMTKRYLSSAGNPEYNERTRGLLFREGSDAHSRARTIQTVGGTGALRVAADFIRKFGTGRRIFLPDPTWANHPAIFGVTGFEIVNYPYYDIATGTLRLDAMMSALANLKPGDTVLLHGCCHNPAGPTPPPRNGPRSAISSRVRARPRWSTLPISGSPRGWRRIARASRSSPSASPR